MAFFTCLDRALVQFFFNYGKVIGRYPLIFLLGSLFVAFGLGTGLIFIQFETDTLYLFTPEESQARTDGDVVTAVFPTNYSEYYTSRGNGPADQGANAILVPKIGNNVLTEKFLADVLRFNYGVENLTAVNDNGTEFQYKDLCAAQHGECIPNPILQAYGYNASRVHQINLTYPFYFPSRISAIFTGASLGDVTLSDADNLTIDRAGLLGMSFHLNTTPELKSICRTWEEEFVSYTGNFESEYVSVSFIVSHTLETELTHLTFTVLPYFTVACALLSIFAIMSCMVADWVRSKTMLATLGLWSALLAVAAAAGLLCFIGVPFNIVAASMPFLIIGIGIDDMFIMIAAWRKSNPLDSVENRMAQTFSEAAVSITITSITDALAFGIGAISSLPAVRIFCLYTGVAIIFDYIFQITFFGACMVYSGRREQANRHCMTLMKVVPRSEAKNKFYEVFCAGGFSEPDMARMANLSKSCETAVMAFFRDFYGPALMNPLMKVLSVVMFAGYIGGAVYGLLQVTEGLEMKTLAGDNSPSLDFFHNQAEYFSEYGPSVSVAIMEPLNYSDPTIQNELENLVQGFENSSYFHSSNFTEFWLRDYFRFLDMLNIPDDVRRESFMEFLVDRFLQIPIFSKYSQDIVFKEGSNKTEIELSRFLILGDSLGRTEDQMAMMADVRYRAANAEIELVTFSPFFIIYEQYVSVRPMTMQNVLIAIGCMFVVALLLIPHPLCAVMVTGCIISILTGIIGYMSLWEVRLDGISMINIILCIGFSVDFSAHITYAFISNEQPANAAGKHKRLSGGEHHAVMALYSLGMPILQGALSTILSVIVLYWSPSYIFRTFFKIIFMVMVFGAIHSLVFLPVLLSALGSCLKGDSRKKHEVGKRAIPDDNENEEGKVFLDDGRILHVSGYIDGIVSVL